MSQLDMFGLESYRETRRVVRGQACAAGQAELFVLVEAAPAPIVYKRGERFMVQRTGMVVTFVRYVGKDSLWECDGDLFRISATLLSLSRLRRPL